MDGDYNEVNKSTTANHTAKQIVPFRAKNYQQLSSNNNTMEQKERAPPNARKNASEMQNTKV